jgi:glycosyltransferase involved in cell wall biosynthesis
MAEAAASHAEAARVAAERIDGPSAEDQDQDASSSGDDATSEVDAAETGAPAPVPLDAGLATRIVRLPRRLAGRIKRRVLRPVKRWWRLFKIFPLRPVGWAASLEPLVEPADIWHGMWAGSLPALRRLSRRFGGRTIYDSRDVYMRSRDFEKAGWPGRAILEWSERRWAHLADRVLTVNDSYADLLVEQLRIPRPAVVMNCPETWHPPEPRPDLIRQALALPPDVRIALYQGQFISDRGIEQAMDAILEVPGAVLALLGYGLWTDKLTSLAAEPPYAGRVAVLPSVPPEELLGWTASADVTVMAIQPTSVNHRYTTPQKLFESIAAGVPVVASDLPGMAEVVRGSGVGLVCDPTSPAAIAAAIRELVNEPEPARLARRAAILRLAHDRYNWERQTARLRAVYGELAEAPAPAADEPPVPAEAGEPPAVAASGAAPAGSNRSRSDA